MNQLHPVMRAALVPFAPPIRTEAELIAADLANNRNKAERAYQEQEAKAMRLQLQYQSVDFQ